ncbi:retrovirus-related pol polyprotein from transposon TNT 1-94 [Tanacetum coccineum]
MALNMSVPLRIHHKPQKRYALMLWLNQSGLPTNLWGEALLAACHIHNRITSRVIPMSPYELWNGRKPNLDYLRVWGCLAYYRTPEPKRSKLEARGIKSVFVGYAKNSKAYRLLDENSGVIIKSKDVEFFEDKFSKDVESPRASLIPTSTGSSLVKTSTEINEPRRSTRARKEKSLGSDFFSYLVEGTQKKVTKEVIFSINIDDDPKTFSEAMSSRDAPLWKEAINDEMDSILDGSISAFKARLVAKGYRQREGLDYFDTYAPVARISSIRTLIAISAIKGLYIHQMDVKTAFLNGYLHEEVYMEQPEGFVIQGQENKVCRLVKYLYGLKQAPKQWHERFDTTVISFRFKHNSANMCIYTKSTKDYTLVTCLYVDDMLIISITINGISKTKSYLSSNFKMKDLGEVDTILRIKVKRTNDQISLSQSHYIEKILTKFQHLHIKESNVPFEPSVHLEKNSGRAVAQLEYASVIGCLMYATHCTRPDIAFAVSKLSQYTSNPSLEHWRAVSKVLGYLKRTSALNLTYTSYPGVLEGYSDASWVNHTGDSKSMSGWIYTLAGGAVSWASKKQTCISHSTMEAEFIALAAAGKEAEWMRDLLLDIHVARTGNFFPYGSVLLRSKRMTMMFISVFAAARMMLLFYVAVVFASEVIMFEYGFDAARMVILLYVAVLFSSELHSSEWGFDAAIFSFVFLLWIIMLLRKKNLEDVSRATLQMQRELLWFKEVERMIPPSHRERKNKDGFTPRELFTMEHQYQIVEGEKWMKSTASQCMVVATLIATIVFAVAFTVPGGYHQNDGIPMFSQKLSFMAFVVADATSLFMLIALILTFLSILTSRYAERNFERSLPMKLMAGLAALFLSIGTMMVTFSVSLFVLYSKEMKWIPIFISLLALPSYMLHYNIIC